MSTSPTTSSHSDGRVSDGEFRYICVRNRQQAYNLLVREFKKSGLTQAQLAKRTGMAPEVISRALKRPRNIEIDTLSKLIFAISRAALVFNRSHPKPQQKTFWNCLEAANNNQNYASVTLTNGALVPVPA